MDDDLGGTPSSGNLHMLRWCGKSLRLQHFRETSCENRKGLSIVDPCPKQPLVLQQEKNSRLRLAVPLNYVGDDILRIIFSCALSLSLSLFLHIGSCRCYYMILHDITSLHMTSAFAVLLGQNGDVWRLESSGDLGGWPQSDLLRSHTKQCGGLDLTQPRYPV